MKYRRFSFLLLLALLDCFPQMNASAQGIRAVTRRTIMHPAPGVHFDFLSVTPVTTNQTAAARVQPTVRAANPSIAKVAVTPNKKAETEADKTAGQSPTQTNPTAKAATVPRKTAISPAQIQRLVLAAQSGDPRAAQQLKSIGSIKRNSARSSSR